MSGFRMRFGIHLVSTIALAFNLLLSSGGSVSAQDESTEDSESPVSYSQQIKPIFQTQCFGCHQPAQQNGDYMMTGFENLVAGGASGVAAVVPGKPEESYLIDLITPHDGSAEMPVESEPLSDVQIQLITRWISEGAKNDSKKELAIYDSENPPVYNRRPNITAADFSPDGKILAVSGFHEILLFDSVGKELVGRLIGLSSRIESIKFSPDGKWLAAAGGNPGELGEVQIWDAQNHSLVMSKPVSHDSVFSICWSPDGTKLAFGGADSILRAIDAKSGKQILFQTAHEDFIREITFSSDGSHLISVSRDMTCKLFEVATERFVDNVTSITPLVLKGGIASIARHPERDEILIGGADGTPKFYRVLRQTKRVIGDDANMIRRFPEMQGRIGSVTISPSGQLFAVASSLDGQSEIKIYAYNFDGQLPDDVKAIMSKVASGRSAEEKKRREEYVTADIKEVCSIELAVETHALVFSSNDSGLVAVGADGIVREYNSMSGDLIVAFETVASKAIAQNKSTTRHLFDKDFTAARPQPSSTNNLLPDNEKNVTDLVVYPDSILLESPSDYAQLVVIAKVNSNGEEHLIDVTSQVSFESVPEQLQIDSGFVQVASAGEYKFDLTLNGLRKSVSVTSRDVDNWHPDFSGDVAPILAQLGCNGGTCHGSQDGQNGFKLSLRGYDRIFDTRSLVGELASRRVDFAAPDNSLMLLKATGKVPHKGGALFDEDDKYYQIIRDWIAEGAKLETSVNPVVSLEVFPKNPVIQNIDQQQSFRVVATFDNGTKRDVTCEAVIESGDREVASMEAHVATALRRGEAALLARYEGAYAATTMTVMGHRSGFSWVDVPFNNQIDELVIDKWKRMKLRPAELAGDATFIRRIYLDITGLPPSVEHVNQFLADERDAQVKRNELIDELIDSDSFVEFWTNKWADLLQVNRKYLGVEGATKFRAWIRDHVSANTPYDEFVRQILTADGSNNENPAASYFKILRTPEDTMENTTHLFLATRFNCNKCHDHPFERWTQDQYYETAAYFAQVELTKDPAGGDKRIGGTAVEGAKPLYEFVTDNSTGEVKHDRTKQVTPPQFPFDCDFEQAENTSRRQELAAWMTAPDNPYFAKSYVNRLWAYMLGVGLIEPIDDIRAGNPPTNPQLLDYLTQEFVDSKFDARHVIRLICKSRVYQLSIQANDFNKDDVTNYSKALARRLPAEVIYDSVHFVTGSKSALPVDRATMLSDSGQKLPSGFLDTLGRPARESSCECERSNEVQLGSVLALISGPDVAKAIDDPKNALAELTKSTTDDRELIDQIYMRVLGRRPTDFEFDAVLASVDSIDQDHQTLLGKRDERTKLVADRLPQLQAERDLAIGKAQTEFDKVLAEKDPTLLEREAERRKKIEAAETALAEFQANHENEFEAWKKMQLERVQWSPVLPTEISASSGVGKFVTRADRTVLVSDMPGLGEYIVTAQTNQVGLSAARLEVLSDPSLPGNGPGTPENGNFVLSEFEIEIAAIGSDEWQKVPIQSAHADFEQKDYLVSETIDGNTGGGNGHGWACVPETGKNHWATFQFQIPVGFRTGSRIRFRLHQNYDPTHQIGCFRISLSQCESPIGLSVSEEYLSKLNSTEISDTDSKLLKQIYDRGNPVLMKLKQTLADVKTPIKVDAAIATTREILDRVSLPIPEDVGLVRLNSDVKYSQQQLESKRLTMAQDLAWALINSPSFLFNH